MKAYFIGGGVGSLAGAAFLVRDGAVAGGNITIYEGMPLLGGSLDGAQLPDGSYSLRGGRMLTTDHYECTWDLLSSIPSLEHPGQTVRDETVAFNLQNKAHSQARLVDRNRFKVDVSTMGFTMHDRMELIRLTEASEEKLGNSRITDWLSPPFFQTNFWYMWQTTFAFQPWHSAVELKRYLHRFMNEFPRIETLAGVKRTVYNQYDSIVRPLTSWLEKQGVQFIKGTYVTDMEFTEDGGKLSVKRLVLDQNAKSTSICVGDDELVFFQNGSMTDASSLGSMTTPPQHLTKVESQGWSLWEKIAAGRPEFGNPAAFNRSIPESYWLSFTATCRDQRFFDQMEAFSGNTAGTGGPLPRLPQLVYPPSAAHWQSTSVMAKTMGTRHKHGGRERYEKALRDLQIELVKVQKHIIKHGHKVLVIFEGRDASGKDGTIKRIVEHLSPRETRVIALGKPTDRDSTSWYFQRYVSHLPAAQELVLFNRSWYNRAGVEWVMKFCTKREYERFMEDVLPFEHMLIGDGIQVLKYYLDIGKKEQKRRLTDRRHDPLKQWKTSPIDEVAVKHWSQYTEARDQMLARTSSPLSP